MKSLSFVSSRMFFTIRLSLFVALLLGASMYGSVSYANGPILWENNITAVMQKAKESNRPVLIHFYGDNCPPCKAMELGVFTDPRVASELNQFFIPIQVNTSKEIELQKQFFVKAIPCDIVLKPNGEILHRREGEIKAEQFLQYLAWLRDESMGKGKPSTQILPVSTAAKPQGTPVRQPGPGIATPAPPVVSNSVPSDPFATVATAPNSPAAQPVIQPGVQPVAASAAIPQKPTPGAYPSAPNTGPVPGPNTSVASNQPVPVPTNMPPNANVNPNPGVPLSPFETQPQARNGNTVPNQAMTPPISDSKPIQDRANPVRIDPSTLVFGLNSPPAPKVEPETSAPETQTGTMVVEIPLALEGFCPVTLGDKETWTPGNPMFYAMYRGMIYRFADEESMNKFQKTPLKYAPVAFGEDIVLVVERNKKAFGYRKYGAWFQGRVYLFSCQETLDAFSVKPEYYAEIAQKYDTAIKTTFDSVQR